MVGISKPRPLRLRYHAVTITSEKNACPQVVALKGVRLLSLEAPRLPLVGCDRPGDCQCRFQHHSDRRAGPRRNNDSTLGERNPAFKGSNRRRMPGRRETDFE